MRKCQTSENSLSSTKLPGVRSTKCSSSGRTRSFHGQSGLAQRLPVARAGRADESPVLGREPQPGDVPEHALEEAARAAGDDRHAQAVVGRELPQQLAQPSAEAARRPAAP